MAETDIGDDESRRTWALGDPRRADAKLRTFGLPVGDAVMCGRCHGSGVIMGREMHWPRGRSVSTGHLMSTPVKCPDCGGEGLDPNAAQGGNDDLE